jgi:hypothetical protein
MPFTDAILNEIHQAATDLVLNPGSVTDQKILDKVHALAQLLAAWESFAKAYSASNRGYEMRDLGVAVDTKYKQTKHVIRSLEQLHGPQAVEHA